MKLFLRASATICFVTFICTIGIANAAQNSGGSQNLTQKEQYTQQLLNASRAHMRAKPIGQSQVPAAQTAQVRQAGITSMRQGPFPLAIFTVQVICHH